MCDVRLLEKFIRAFNSARGERFSFDRQLDASGSTKQPEARYTSPAGTAMVVERKSLIWPPEYAKYHKTLHDIETLVSQGLSDVLEPARAYRLVLPDLVRGTRSEIESFTGRLVECIRAELPTVRRGRSIRSAPGVVPPWHFRQETGERDYWEPDSGLVFEFRGSMSSLDWGEIPVGLIEEANRLLQVTEKKFLQHLDSRRVLVFVPFGGMEGADEDLWASLLAGLQIPGLIDEIWSSAHQDIWDLACGWVHRQLWPVVGEELVHPCRNKG